MAASCGEDHSLSLCPAIILSAVAWFTFYSYQKVIGDLAIKQDLAVLDTKIVQAADGINNLINSSLVPIILNVDTKPELSLEVRAQNVLDRAPNLDVFDGGVYFVDQHGIVFKSQPEQPELIGRLVHISVSCAHNLRRSVTNIQFTGQTGGMVVSSGRCTTHCANLLARVIIAWPLIRMSRTISTQP
jgi:hypothetical protein